MAPNKKSEILELICCAVSQRAFPKGDELFLTNFGIASNLKCKLPVSKGNYVFGRPENFMPERATFALILELCTDCADFIDVGANDGLFTFAVNHDAPGRIRLHWFEPDSAIYDRLAENLKNNLIVAFGNRAAVSSDTGSATFLKNLTDESSGSLMRHFSSHETVEEKVTTVSLADYFHRHHIENAIVKVDVEGAGELVWRGACDVSQHIRYLIMEIIEPESRCNLPERIISEGGFFAYHIRDFDLTFCEKGEQRYVAPFWNWLFCRMPPELLARRVSGTRFRVIKNAA